MLLNLPANYCCNLRSSSTFENSVQGILSGVYVDATPLYKWKMLPISLENLNESQNINSVITPNATVTDYFKRSAHKKLERQKSK